MKNFKVETKKVVSKTSKEVQVIDLLSDSSDSSESGECEVVQVVSPTISHEHSKRENKKMKSLKGEDTKPSVTDSKKRKISSIEEKREKKSVQCSTNYEVKSDENSIEENKQKKFSKQSEEPKVLDANGGKKKTHTRSSSSSSSSSLSSDSYEEEDSIEENKQQKFNKPSEEPKVLDANVGRKKTHTRSSSSSSSSSINSHSSLQQQNHNNNDEIQDVFNFPIEENKQKKFNKSSEEPKVLNANVGKNKTHTRSSGSSSFSSFQLYSYEEEDSIEENKQKKFNKPSEEPKVLDVNVGKNKTHTRSSSSSSFSLLQLNSFEEEDSIEENKQKKFNKPSEEPKVLDVNVGKKKTHIRSSSSSSSSSLSSDSYEEEDSIEENKQQKFNKPSEEPKVLDANVGRKKTHTRSSSSSSSSSIDSQSSLQQQNHNHNDEIQDVFHFFELLCSMQSLVSNAQKILRKDMKLDQIFFPTNESIEDFWNDFGVKLYTLTNFLLHDDAFWISLNLNPSQNLVHLILFLHITNVIGDGIIKYAVERQSIFQRALDSIKNVEIISRRRLILEQRNQKKICEEDEGYKLGLFMVLSMLYNSTKNIFMDVEKQFFLRKEKKIVQSNKAYNLRTQRCTRCPQNFHLKFDEKCTICLKGNGNIVKCKDCSGCFHEHCLDGQDVCPMCISAKKLMKVVEKNEMKKIRNLLVYNIASPLLSIENESALHISVRQNNYELASMLLTGIRYINQKNELKLSSQQFHNRCWGRDGCQKGFRKSQCWQFHHNTCCLDPFMRSIKSGSKCNPPPIESLLLLSARGGGDMKMIKNIYESMFFPSLDISQGLEKVPIPWVNETGDGEKLKADFIYVSHAVESHDVGISWFRNLKKLSEVRCCKTKLHGKCMKYNIRGRSYNIECNYFCECAQEKIVIPANGKQEIKQCGNRHLGYGVVHGLEIFRTRDGRGWGVRTNRDQWIEKDEIICEYCGIYRKEKDMAELEEFYKRTGRKSYILNLSQSIKRDDSQYVIDGTEYRSVSGFFNHGCGDIINMEQFHALSNHFDSDLPLVGFRATKRIPPLTELCFNYRVKMICGVCAICSKQHCLCPTCMNEKHPTSRTIN